MTISVEPGRQRQYEANRNAIKEHLIREGMNAELAERWLTAWEGTSNWVAGRYVSDFWSRGGQWALSAWMARQEPPTIER